MGCVHRKESTGVCFRTAKCHKSLSVSERHRPVSERQGKLKHHKKTSGHATIVISKGFWVTIALSFNLYDDAIPQVRRINRSRPIQLTSSVNCNLQVVTSFYITKLTIELILLIELTTKWNLLKRQNP